MIARHWRKDGHRRHGHIPSVQVSLRISLMIVAVFTFLRIFSHLVAEFWQKSGQINVTF